MKLYNIYIYIFWYLFIYWFWQLKLQCKHWSAQLLFWAVFSAGTVSLMCTVSGPSCPGHHSHQCWTHIQMRYQTLWILVCPVCRQTGSLEESIHPTDLHPDPVLSHGPAPASSPALKILRRNRSRRVESGCLREGSPLECLREDSGWAHVIQLACWHAGQFPEGCLEIPLQGGNDIMA